MSLDFNLTDEHKMVQQSIKDAIAPWATTRRSEMRKMVRESVFPHELWQTFADVGLLGCLVPEQYGGSGMGLLTATLGFEAVTQLNVSPNILLVTCMDAACISRNASDALKQQYLPGIADGSKKFCFAITEPDAGTNSFMMKTRATRHGDTFVINGQKTYISGIEVADYMLLVARSTPVEESKQTQMGIYHGLSLFIVPTKAKGITAHKIAIGFNEGVGQYTVFFDNVEVPADHVVGDIDMGALVMFNSLNPERILAAAMCSGMADYCLDTASAYAKERKVFRDVPIGKYQGIAHPLAEAKAHHEAARLMLYKAAWAFDAGWEPAKVGSLANMCKLLNADSAVKAADVGIETLGGLGFTEDQGMLQVWNGARLFKTAPVSREMILNYIAEQELGLPKSY